MQVETEIETEIETEVETEVYRLTSHRSVTQYQATVAK